MTQPLDTEAAIKLVQQQLERYLPGDLEASEQQRSLTVAEGLVKALRSGLLAPNGTIDQDKAEDLMAAAAAGDKLADIQVTCIAIWLRQNGHPLPDSFRKIEISLWRERLPTPRGNRNRGRDIQYCMAIHRLQEYGFNPTRNRVRHGKADTTESGCSILSKALAGMGEHVPEQRLEKIWEKYSNFR